MAESSVKEHLERKFVRLYARPMTDELEDGATEPEPLEAVAALLRALDSIEDPGECYRAVKVSRDAFDEGARAVLQRATRKMRVAGATWREVGETFGGVSAQRAEQISRGV